MHLTGQMLRSKHGWKRVTSPGLAQAHSSLSHFLQFSRHPLPRGTRKWSGISLCTQSMQSKPGTLGKHQIGAGNANGTCSVMQPGKVQSAWPSRTEKVGPAGAVPVTPESFPAGKVGRSRGSGWAAQEALCLQRMLAVLHVP